MTYNDNRWYPIQTNYIRYDGIRQLVTEQLQCDTDTPSPHRGTRRKYVLPNTVQLRLSTFYRNTHRADLEFCFFAYPKKTAKKNYEIMKTLDLHGTERYGILDCIERFVTDNFDNLPIKIITGNSSYNISKVNEVAERYNLSVHKERWINNGAWIVND